MSRKLPPSASVAQPGEGDKLFAPAAERNAESLTALIRDTAPQSGNALELASGTGQHVVHFAAATPGLEWQPTDVETNRLRSIDAHVTESELKNVATATFLDATKPGWAGTFGPRDLIVLVNLLHLITTDEARIIVDEVAKALALGGTLILYGPFARNGQLTSEGDRRFDAELRATDPRIGYKDTSEVENWLSKAGLIPTPVQEMPANNLTFLARKP